MRARRLWRRDWTFTADPTAAELMSGGRMT
jgi:hypothetical protein